MLKVICEPPDHWTNIVMMVPAMRIELHPHDPLVVELMKSLCAHRETIDRIPKMKHAAHFPELTQGSPCAQTKYSVRMLASPLTPVQAFMLEFASSQEDCIVSAASMSIVL